jgi:phosphonate transport system substrate-binding protein
MQTKITTMRFFIAITTVSILCSIQPAWSASPTDGYTFGIGPTQSATELAKHWLPIMQYLSQKSGVPLQFMTTKDIPAFQQQMRKGVYDFAYINPYNYLQDHKVSGYNAFAREKDGKLFGILVVKKGGSIQEVEQLNGLTVAFPTAAAIASTWLPLGMLKDKGVQVTPQYVNSMDSVYLSVAKGLFPAGGGELRTFGTIDPAVKNELQILWTSEGLPPFAFAAHPRVPKKILEKVQKAMSEMEHDAQGMALLKANNFKGIEVTDDSEYNDMRKLNIKPVPAK